MHKPPYDQALLERLLADQQQGQHLQSLLLPEPHKNWSSYQFHSLVRPSLYLSGDTLDYLPISESQCLFYLADVAGHGTAAALGSILLQGLIRQAASNYSKAEQTPADLLTSLNQQWLKIGMDKHATLMIGCISHLENTLQWSMAGHLPSPILFDQHSAKFLSGKGQPLGLFQNAQFTNNCLRLPEQFSLHLFSDGVFELLSAQGLRNQEQKLLALIEQTQGVWDLLLNHLSLDVPHQIEDDVALLTVSRTV